MLGLDNPGPIDFNSPVPGYGKILPADSPHFRVSNFGGWFFLFWAGLLVVAIALPWCINQAVKHKRYLPILTLAAGVVTSLGEPMLDLVGHLRWAENLQSSHYHNFGIHIPLLIPPCYGLFMGLEAYWIWSMIQRGLTVKNMYMIFAAVGLSDAVMEMPGLALGAYKYYGHQPFMFWKFPFYWSFTNAASIMTVAVLVHFTWPLVKDYPAKRLLVIPCGIIATTMAEFGCGFPVFLAVNSYLPVWAIWAVGSLTLVISVVWCRVLAELVGRKDAEVEWTFLGLFKSRFMLPQYRDAYIQGMTRPVAHPAAAAEKPAVPVG
ncbi:MAG TPA: hypothetical protein VHU88_13575 [Sporichthyaceae bacterium]|jgi:hypothetical protein|nr:hypothetical protein [Sporichthyaceae bacterium]